MPKQSFNKEPTSFSELQKNRTYLAQRLAILEKYNNRNNRLRIANAYEDFADSIMFFVGENPEELVSGHLAEAILHYKKSLKACENKPNELEILLSIAGATQTLMDTATDESLKQFQANVLINMFNDNDSDNANNENPRQININQIENIHERYDAHFMLAQAYKTMGDDQSAEAHYRYIAENFDTILQMHNKIIRDPKERKKYGDSYNEDYIIQYQEDYAIAIAFLTSYNPKPDTIKKPEKQTIMDQEQEKELAMMEQDHDVTQSEQTNEDLQQLIANEQRQREQLRIKKQLKKRKLEDFKHHTINKFNPIGTLGNIQTSAVYMPLPKAVLSMAACPELDISDIEHDYFQLLKTQQLKSPSIHLNFKNLNTQAKALKQLNHLVTAEHLDSFTTMKKHFQKGISALFNAENASTADQTFNELIIAIKAFIEALKISRSLSAADVERSDHHNENNLIIAAYIAHFIQVAFKLKRQETAKRDISDVLIQEEFRKPENNNQDPNMLITNKRARTTYLDKVNELHKTIVINVLTNRLSDDQLNKLAKNFTSLTIATKETFNSSSYYLDHLHSKLKHKQTKQALRRSVDEDTDRKIIKKHKHSFFKKIKESHHPSKSPEKKKFKSQP